MNKEMIVLMRIKEFFRRNPQTSWGKNQLFQVLDDIDDKIQSELASVKLDEAQ